MKIKDFKDKKVTIIGLGLHGGGVGIAKFFTRIGAKVLVTDLRNKEELKESLEQLEGRSIKYVLGQHRPEDFVNTDLVVKSPAVPENSRYLEIARENKVPIETDIGIFFELCPVKIIGVTGSKGKSTVATLIARFLERKYSDVVLAGNIRTSVLGKLAKINKNSLVVLELSSWQLAGLKSHRKSPQLALITNIMPDHLNRYKNMTEYIEDKKLIFRWQKSKDYLVLNYDDKVVRDLAKGVKAQVLYYSQANGGLLNPESANWGAFVKGEKIFFDQNRAEAEINKEEICSLEEVRLKGEHNINNVLAAITVAKLYNVSNKSIKKILDKFKGLEGRIELVGTVNEVKYINDTTATIPEATLAALNSFSPKKNIILIAGGADKNLNFDQLAEMISKKVKALILLEGMATPKLKKSVEEQIELTGSQSKIIGPLNNMEEAVIQAKSQAQEKDIVLLSPACASFGLFRHEFERGIVILFALIIFGLVILSSASVVISQDIFGQSYYFLKHQLFYSLPLGLLCFFILQKIPYKHWQKLALPLLILSLSLLALVFVPGIGYGYGEAKRWIAFGPFSLQPIELTKLSFILYLAALLSKKRETNDQVIKESFIPFLVALGIIGCLVLFQPNLSALIIVVLIAGFIYFLAGIKIYYLLAMVGLALVAFFALIKTAAYRVHRLTVFLHPELDPQGIGYQINQALLAIGSGGLFGLGLGHSIQKWKYLPEAISDSIFAIAAEELGLIGASLIVALFILLAWRGLKIARNAPERFGYLLAGGITAWLFFQAFVNMAAISGLIPLTGMPLPFISYGGSAIIASLAAMGILVNISKYTK